jgi:hypothetical protein
MTNQKKMMDWRTFNFFWNKLPKNSFKNSIACKSFLGEKDVQDVQSFSKVISLAPSYRF